MKRFICLFMTAILSFMVFTSTLFAAESLDYWYSSASNIYRYYNNNVNVYISSRGHLPAASLDSYIKHAGAAWENSIGTSRIDIVYVSSSSNANIIAEDITRAEANSYGYPTSAVAVGGTVTGTSYATASYNGSLKTFYKGNTGMIRLIWGESTRYQSISAWKYTAAHELGHALGYRGHNPNSGTLMYATFDPNNIIFTTPRTKDHDHMVLVYLGGDYETFINITYDYFTLSSSWLL